MISSSAHRRLPFAQPLIRVGGGARHEEPPDRDGRQYADEHQFAVHESRQPRFAAEARPGEQRTATDRTP
jgi:hypothetical protein